MLLEIEPLFSEYASCRGEIMLPDVNVAVDVDETDETIDGKSVVETDVTVELETGDGG